MAARSWWSGEHLRLGYLLGPPISLTPWLSPPRLQWGQVYPAPSLQRLLQELRDRAWLLELEAAPGGSP